MVDLYACAHSAATAKETTVDMSKKCGLGVLRVLLLAALLSAFGIWFLPVSSATAEIFLLLSGQAVAQPPVSTESYKTSTTVKNLTGSGHLETRIVESNTQLNSHLNTSYIGREHSQNTTLTDRSTQPAFAPSTAIYPAQTIDTLSVSADPTGPVNLTTQEQPLPSLITSTDIEISMTCTQATHPTDAEVLAIAVGAVFITIIISALLYQWVLYMRKKKVNRDSSIYIIEDELPKYEMDVNSVEPETKL
ncbi:hypothetical protein GDO86_002124 [Hymenochirus boettgeri]|uniref:Uncharacterized protein n=1 Tax=Hymenochirus boettgeri TaxID=247094 RepID=A0A8T2KH93_9PIPI|nr:hypothetical protein GDO86_002124 [Hymenochirus boettgeri]